MTIHGNTIQTEVVRDRDMTLSSMATVYGCCGLFDLCGDRDLLSLSFAGQEPFLDWIGWEPSVVCDIRKYFLTWIRPEQYNDACTTGLVSDPCADGSGAEWGACDFRLHDFGRIRRVGPVRDATKNDLRLCEAQPRYRLDGSMINDDAEFDMRIAGEVLMQDLKRLVVGGSNTVAGGFDGLENLVVTGYVGTDGKRCSIMDSTVIDWNGNTMNGGAGVTWNGAAVAATANFVDVLLAAFRRIRDRIAMAPALASQNLAVGDIVLVAPTSLIRCILDAYTCWSVCVGVAFNEVNIQTYEGRTYRNGLNGGMFQAGRIYLDGFEIPLIAYNWGLQKGPTLADCYLLTGQIGSVKLIQGQYKNMSAVPAGYPEAIFSTTDGGRILTWLDQDNTCVKRSIEMQPRLLMWAPWAQVRFQDVKCVQPGGVILPDPCETSFFPETSFNTPVCPTDLVLV